MTQGARGRGGAGAPDASLRKAICEGAEDEQGLAREQTALAETLARLDERLAELQRALAAERAQDGALEERIEAGVRRRRELLDEQDTLRGECAALELEIGATERVLDRLQREEAAIDAALSRAREATSAARCTVERAQESILRMDYRLRHEEG